MLRSVEVASASISLTTRCGMAGRPRCFPRVWADLMPAVTRSLMSEDSSSAMAPIMAPTNELPLRYEFCDETRTSVSEGGSAPRRQREPDAGLPDNNLNSLVIDELWQR